MDTYKQPELQAFFDGAAAPQAASLRDKALARATADYQPRTLTPYEWEQWYAEHGVPPGHRGPAAAAGSRWQRLKDLISRLF